jgi:hypothetical protein
MRWLRRRDPDMPPPGFRGTHCFPEVGLPDGFVPPSAALAVTGEPRGEIIGYEVAGKLYHPDDVLIVRAAP